MRAVQFPATLRLPFVVHISLNDCHRPELLQSALFERILCPRIHTKAVIVDGRIAFVGSANLTGAGLGAKHADKRNFGAGFITTMREHIDPLVEFVDALYLGQYCRTCRLREHCPDPIA